tara:strand:- start:26497 stop:26778 length:282 start_codon:yes stop_codon:yes gene_type:complete
MSTAGTGLKRIVLFKDIKMAFEAQKKNTGDQDAAIERIANDLSIAIDKYIKSGLVVTDPGQLVATVVATAGTATNQGGAGAGATSSTGTGRVI